MAVQVFAEDFLRSGGVAVHQEHRTQRFAYREEPVLGLVVLQRVLHRDGFLQLCDRAGVVLLRQGDFRAQHIPRDLQDVFGLVVHRHGESHVFRSVLLSVGYHLIIRLCFVRLSLGSQGHATCEVPEDGFGLHFRTRVSAS